MNDKILVSKGKAYHFYFKNGIYTKCLDSTSPPVCIFSDAYFDFDVISDDDGIIHLICQDKKGSVIYFSGSESAFEKEILLLSKTKTAYNKNFKIIGCGKLIFALYTIVKDSKTLLIFHCVNEKLTPIVVDYITPSPRSFFVRVSKNFDINIYYSNSDGVLVSKKYQWSKKAFLPFESISTGGICPFSADEDRIVFLSDRKIYLKEKNELCEIFTYTSGDISSPVCFFKNNNLFVLWEKDNSVYSFKYNDKQSIKKLLSTLASPSLFEIKTNSFSTVYLYGIQTQNSIHFISPEGQIHLKDFFNKKDEKTEYDKLDLILKKLTNIEKMLGGI